jgi:hypothetical protein
MGQRGLCLRGWDSSRYARVLLDVVALVVAAWLVALAAASNAQAHSTVCYRSASEEDHCYALSRWYPTSGYAAEGSLVKIDTITDGLPGWAEGDFFNNEMWVVFHGGHWAETGSRAKKRRKGFAFSGRVIMQKATKKGVAGLSERELVRVRGRLVKFASGNPVSPSTQQTRMSSTPRRCRSFRTASRNLAPLSRMPEGRRIAPAVVLEALQRAPATVAHDGRRGSARSAAEGLARRTLLALTIGQ